MMYDDSADIYDLQYEAYRADVPHYVRLADDVGGPVLELGAGTGRITEALARAGHHVVGVEPSAAMRARAAARFGDAPWANNITFIAGDMRNLALKRQFPLIIAPFNTLMHAYTLEDQDRTFAAVRAHLVPGGVFAFDLYRPQNVQTGVLRVEPEWQDLQPGLDVFLLQNHDPVKQVLTSTYYIDRSVAGQLSRRRTVLSQRYYHRFELERLLRQHGFTYRLFGSFEKDLVGEHSNYFVVVASGPQ